MFLVSDLSPKPGEKGLFVCYSDKEELGRWIRDTTIGTLPEFKNHDLRKIQIKPGRFAAMGDTRSSWTELISTAEYEIRLTWGELRQPFNLRVPVGAVPSIPYEINTIIYPRRPSRGGHQRSEGGRAGVPRQAWRSGEQHRLPGTQRNLVPLTATGRRAGSPHQVLVLVDKNGPDRSGGCRNEGIRGEPMKGSEAKLPRQLRRGRRRPG